MDRIAAVNALRQAKVFANTSLRLLSDFVERNQDECQRASGEGESRFLSFPRDCVLESYQASFSFFASLDLGDWPEDEEPPRAPAVALHAIWVSERRGLGAPLEALTHLLAASVARDFDEPVAVVTFRGRRAEVAVWEEKEFVTLAPSGTEGAEAVRRAIEQRGQRLCHVFYVDPSRPQTIPHGFDGLRFHRVVFVTDVVPAEVPPAFEKRIVARARNKTNPAAPYFCSFVPSVLRAERQGGGEAKPFSEPIVEGERDGEPPERVAVRRLNRDLCRIPYDVEDLRERWKEAAPGRRRSFANDLLDHEAEYASVSSHWARAITNRQVGLALSGGGASSYRMIALVEMLEERGVPIDVVSGVSGGTLVGAYYCKRRGADLDRCVDNGLLFQLLVLGAMFDSRLIRRRVDRDLGGARVDDVDVRLVPVATALRHGRPPGAHVICGGTLGEAVQASGAAPGLFSSMQRRENGSGETTRYTDGASSRLIPARVLPQYGADLVIAFNTIAGPRRRNPFEKHRTGRFLYEKTPVGRAIDLWVSVAFLVEQCSGVVAEDAHVFIEPLPHDEPFVEALWFARARAIVEDARSRDALREKADLCQKRWREFCANPAILPRGAEQAPLPRSDQRARAVR